MSATRPAVAMYVYNDATLDSRVRREAATLAAAGYPVTVLATARSRDVGAIEREAVDGYEIVRVPVPEDWHEAWRRVVSPWTLRRTSVGRLRRSIVRPRRWGEVPGALGGIAAGVGLSLARHAVRLAARLRRRDVAKAWPPADLTWLVQWRLSILAWARDAAAAAPAARIHHGHDLTGLPAALAGMDRAGDRAIAVYDSHEIFVSSGRNADRPWWARALLRRLERRWAGRTAALVTVNRPYADVIADSIHPRRIAIVHNCPPHWSPGPEDAGRLAAAAGIGDGAPIVLYHGAFSRYRGMEQLSEAMLDSGLGRAHLVFLGYGGERATVDRIAADPRFGGRIHVLDAVPPDQLLGLVAGADVDAIPLLRSTLNHWLCTPNKLFESIAAGVPVVVSDFPTMREIVLGDPSGPLGAVCDPTSPASIAAAIRSVLDAPPDERQRLRERCTGAAAERWNWERESRALLELYAELSEARP